MILVAFVLVLVATVMLIIGTFFDGGTAYIWISIGACVATFGVLAASYFARRRGADDEGAQPRPLGAGESRSASVQSAPRGTTVSPGGTTTATRERTETETETEQEDESSVTIVPSTDEATPDEATDEAGSEPAAPDEDEADAPAPAPRRVAPRRVVRHAPAAETPAADSPAAEAPDEPAETPPAWPSKDADAPEDVEDAVEAPAPAAAAGDTPRVVRRAEDGGTRKVVRRAAATGGAAGGTRKVRRVVRRTAGAAEGQRTVKRVVRRAPAGGEEAAAEKQQPQEKATPDRSGTRGKRARAVLSEIKGVGPAKQDALLKRFGSLENMAAASIDELADVKGVGESVAAAIKQSLQDR